MSGNLIGAAALVVDATVSGATRASIGTQAVIAAADLSVAAVSRNSATADPVVANISLIGGGAGAKGAATIAAAAVTAAAVDADARMTLSGDLSVSADAQNKATASAKGGSGGATLAVAVMLSDASVAGGTSARMDGDVLASSAVTVQAVGVNAADADTVTAAIGGAGGAGANANATVAKEAVVEASAASSADITSSGAVAVTATSVNTATATSDGGAGGAFAVAAMLPTATVSGKTLAFMDGDVSDAGSLAVKAKGTNTAAADTLVVAIAIAGGAGANATANVTADADVEAELGANSKVNVGGAVLVDALATQNKATAEAEGGAGGAISIGVMLSNASVAGGTYASMAGDVTRASAVTVQSVGNNLADADTLTVSIGIVAGAGANATATVSEQADVEAFVSSSSEITAPGGAVTVSATSINEASAVSDGGSGGGIAVAVMLPTATVAGGTVALMDGDLLDAATLDVKALGDSKATSSVLVVAVGLAVGAGAKSVAEVTAASNVEAAIGSAASITTTGTVNVEAISSREAGATARGGAGGFIAAGGITSDSSVRGSTSAHVNDGGTIAQAGKLQVKAESLGASANSQTVVGSGGFVSVGVTAAEALNRSSVSAYVGDNAVVNTRASGLLTGDVLIRAIGRAESDANALVAGGGVIQVGTAQANADIRPTVDAHVGSSARIRAAGDVGVDAQLLRSGAKAAPSDAIKSVNAGSDTLGFEYELNSGDVVQYQAPAGTDTFGLTNGREYNVLVATPGSAIRLGNAFDATRVDALNDTITFTAPHNFQSGDRVVYNGAGGVSIVQPWQTTLDPSNPLYVNPAATLFVRGIQIDPAKPSNIDPYSIKLARSFAEATTPDSVLLRGFDGATQVNAATDLITAPGHAFVNGQSVTYRASNVQQFFTESVDVKRVDRTYVDKDGIERTAPDIERAPDPTDPKKPGTGLHFDNNNIFMAAYGGFKAGDAVTYRNTGRGPAIGGLVDGGTYYVMIDPAKPDQIQLAASYDEAVGRPFEARGDGEADDILAIAKKAIALTPPLDPLPGDSQWDPQSGSHSLSRNIKGLQDGTTYYVVNSDTGAGTFGLAATRGGATIQIDNGDDIPVFQRNGALARTEHPITRDGTHRIGTAGIDLQAGTGTQTLYMDLGAAPASLAGHRLLGAGGVLLSSISPPAGDGLSGATARGGSGGVGDFAFPSAKLTATPTVTAYVGALSDIEAGGTVSIASDARTGVSTYGDTAGGGGLSVGEAHADTYMSGAFSRVFDAEGRPTDPPVSTRSYVGANASIKAGGDFLLTADSDHSVSATARSTGGGVISAKIAETTSWLNFETLAQVGAGATLSADGAVKLHSTSRTTGRSDSETYSVGVGAGADSDNTNDDRGVDVDALTQVDVGAGASVVGRTVDIDAYMAQMDADARAKSTAYSPIFFGVATAFSDASVQVDSDAKVLILGNLGGGRYTEINGARGVDIQARQAEHDVDRDASQLAVALIPPQASRALGQTNQNSTVNADAGAVVYVVPRDTDPALLAASGLVSRPGYNLALFVEAGLASEDGVTQKVRNIEWDADVVSAAGPNPELIVDTDGRVVRAINITVNGMDTPAKGTLLAGSVSVGPIYNDGDGGDVIFEAKATNTADGTITQQHALPIAGKYWSTFYFRDSFAEVRITNESALDLIIDTIDLVNAVSVPRVVLDTTPPAGGEAGSPLTTRGDSVSLQFDLVHTPWPALIDIKNLNKHATADVDPSDIILRGTGILKADGTPMFPGSAGIENPAGETRILTTRGNIVSDPPAGKEVVIRTRTLGDASAVVLPKDFERIEGGLYTGSLRFDTNGTDPDTITRTDGGDWTALGFVVGDLVKVSGDPANRTAFQVAAIGGAGNSVLTLNTLAAVAPGTVTATVTRFHGIEATTGNIGSGLKRVRVDLVESGAGSEALFAEAGTSLYLDVQGRLRQDLPAGAEFQVNLDFVGAGADANVVMRGAVVENANVGNDGVLVKVPSEALFVNFVAFRSFFRPDDGQPAGIVDPAPPRRAFGVDPAAPRIDSTFDFGLIQAGSHIRITALDSTAPDGDTRVINVRGVSDIRAGGEFIDILTNGFIGTTADPWREIVAVDPADGDDLRIGRIHSTSDDVVLLAPRGLVDATARTTTRVAGRRQWHQHHADRAGGRDGFGRRVSWRPTCSTTSAAPCGRCEDRRLTPPQGDVFVEEISSDLRLHSSLADLATSPSRA